MNRTVIGLVLMSALAFARSYAASQNSTAPARAGVHSLLRVGQTVELAPFQGNVFINIYEDEAYQERMTSKVQKIGEDFIVFTLPPAPEMGSREMHVPFHALHSITIIHKEKTD